MHSPNIVNKKPALLFILKYFFPMAGDENVVITFGLNIYSLVPLSPDLFRHELTHCYQQGFSRIKATIWWIRYILDKKFRYYQEVEAYRNQYYYAQRHYKRERAFRVLRQIASDLSGPIYGNLVSQEQAMKDIKQ